MATVSKVLAHVDELEPNPFSDTVKATWLTELDGKIWAEVMHKKPRGLLSPAPPAYGPGDWDRELLVPAPYDNLYPLYVEAMVHYHNQEIDRYNNAMLLYQEAMDEFRKWYTRSFRPPRAGGFKNYQ